MRVLKALGLIGFGVILGVGGAIQAASSPQAVSESRLTTGKMEWAGSYAFRFMKDSVTGQCYIIAINDGVSAITPTERNACTF